jgi:hypothetical protein
LIKLFFIALLFFSFAQAGAIEKQTKNILGKQTYMAKKGLLSVLFKNKGKFLRGNHLDMVKVLETLKSNKLLDLRFRYAQTLELNFATTGRDTLLFIKIIKDTLNALGYNHTLTSKAIRDESGFLWQVQLRSASMVDPLSLAKEFRKRGAYFTSLKRYSKDRWRYNINISQAKVLAKKLLWNMPVPLRKPLEPYWFDVQGARTIRMDSKRANLWHPYIVFYDKDLAIVDTYTKERKSYNVSLKIPHAARYVKVGDLYTLENLKRGLTITLKK